MIRRTPLLYFALIFFSLPSTLFAVEFKQYGCVVEGPGENKLRDYSIDRIREKMVALSSMNIFGARRSLFDFKYANPFAIVPNSETVPYDLTTTSKVLVLLVEFSDAEGGGPKHNQIEAPPLFNNAAFWVDDFSIGHYQEMLFDRTPGQATMANFYLENSSGRYTVEGDVYGWFSVPHDESHYGKDGEPEGGNPNIDNANGPQWRIISDLLPSVPEGSTDWSQYDVTDRYDWDNDGDFNEPDGYIDYVMVIHAGVGQEAGGGAQGRDAIWSHRGRANFQPPGTPHLTGPSQFVQRGGILIDPKNDLWILDYTMMPENGAVGVFSHEFGHDLGLPDLYDTRPKNGSESSVAFWSVMSMGSWASLEGEPIGTFPTHFSAYEKKELGWLDYDEVKLGNEDLHKFALLDRAEFHGQNAQALEIHLPEGIKVAKVFEPIDGNFYEYSDVGDERVQALSTEIDLSGVDEARLTFKVNYDIEPAFDYAYVEIEDAEGKLVSIPGNITTVEDPNGTNIGHGITGTTGGKWIDADFDLTPYVGFKRRLRFRYITDPAEGGKGFAIDDLKIDAIGFHESFETQDHHWSRNGFVRLANGEVSREYSHSYMLEWRTNYGFDRALGSLSYFMAPGLVRYFSYQPGLVLWYRNGSLDLGDNRVGQHPGEGGLLVVDARAEVEWLDEHRPFGTRYQIHDAAFGFEPSLKHDFGGLGKVFLGGTEASSVFNDSLSYFHAEQPYSSVETPNVGVRFSLLNISPDGSSAQLMVHYVKPQGLAPMKPLRYY